MYIVEKQKNGRYAVKKKGHQEQVKLLIPIKKQFYIVQRKIKSLELKLQQKKVQIVL